MTVMIDDKAFIAELRKTGITAKRWMNDGEYTPPADVNYRGELRVHTGGKPELVATDADFKQAVIKPTVGRYKDESFLVGMDETSNFVCRLPKDVGSVQEAHDILRPMGVMPHTTRQGEWFFVPVEGELPPKLDHRMNRQLGGTTHSAQFYAAGYPKGSMRFTEYARGLISDNRKGRHAPVNLGETWHEVFRNTEKTLDQEPQRPKVRHFD